ncbi:MAG: PilZ domain-containing protein [Thermodesulfobacteriota bacterium]|jgi:c-di-GMP-binding flagellar brake protein YcgR
MEKVTPYLERRRYPRMSLDLPLEYRVMNAPYAHGGLVINASEVGLLINSIKNIPIGSKLNIAVLFPKGFELTNFEVLAEILWKDLYWEEDWEGYRYGLKFIKILEGDRRKLKQLLSGQFELGEISPNL